jgi:pimeloyl-ACP methyl ester carboxylesterase
VRDHLRARGHRVITPALPGRGDVGEDRAWIGHDDNVAAVLAALDADTAADTAAAGAGGPVVLAGHSLGGVTISQVADQRPDRIARLIYCAAFVLDDGESAGDVMPEHMRAAITELSTTRPDRAIPMPWDLWRQNFIQTASEQLARESHERMVPDPYRPVFEPVKLRRPVHRELPATFVAFTQDKTMPPGFWHPGMSGRMSGRLNGGAVIEIDGDHQMLLTAPGPLADALHHAATTPG